MKLVKLLLLVGSLIGAQAFAGQVALNEYKNPTAFLPSCQGMATLSRSPRGELVLMLNNTANCSILEVQGHSTHGQIANGAVIEEVPGRNMIVATVHSRSGSHSDALMITSYVRPTVHAGVFLDSHRNKFASLNSCGGTVELKMVRGQADLIFRGVRECSNFDIIESNGRPTQYPNKKLEGANGDRGGSFTLPSYVIDFGFNGVLVTMKSNSGKHADVIYVQFLDL